MSAAFSKRRINVHPAVKAVVMVWANASDLSTAAKALRAARSRLDPTLQAELRAEVAEITAEALFVLLNNPDCFVPGQPIEVMGLQLLPRQVERFAAWLQDQRDTASALGLDLAQWKRALEAGIERYIQRTKSQGS